MPGNTNRYPVDIPSASRVPQPQVDTEVGVMPDAGGAHLFEQAAGIFAGQAERIGRLADHAAAKEGEDAGAVAGLDPEFRPTKRLTIRGEAFDNAGIDVAGKRLKMQMAADMDAAAEKYGDDPGRLQAALAGRAKHYAEQGMALDPQLGADITLTYQSHSLSLVRQATRAANARAEAAQSEAIASDLETGYSRATQAAYNLGLDAQADEALAGMVAQYGKSLSASVNGKPVLTPKAQAKHLEQFREAVFGARMIGAIERTPDVEGKAKFISQFRDDWAAGKYPDMDLVGRDRLMTHMDRDLNRAEAEARLGLKRVEDAAKAQLDAVVKGSPVSELKIAELRSAGWQAGAPAAEDAARAAIHTLTAVEKIHGAPLHVAEQAVAALRHELDSSGENPVLAARVELMDKALGEKRDAIRKAPYAYYRRAGLLPAAPLDFADPDRLAASLGERARQRQVIQAREGGRDLPLLEESDKALLTGRMEAGPQSLAGVLKAAADGLGKDAITLFRELGQDRHAGQLAYLGGWAMSGAGPDDVGNLAIYLRQKGEEGYKVRLKEGMFRRADVDKWWEASAGAMFAGQPQTASAVKSLALGLADIRAKRNGDETITEESYNAAIVSLLGERTVGNQVYGGIATVGGDAPDRSLIPNPIRDVSIAFDSGAYPVIVPPFVRQDRFAAAKDALSSADLEALGAPRGENGAALSIGDFRRARLKAIGGNRYEVMVGSEDDPQLPLTADGKPWVLDFDRVRYLLGHRHPEFFLFGD